MVKLAKAAGGTVQVHIGQGQVQWLGVVKKKEEPIPDLSEYTRPQVKNYSNKDVDDGSVPAAA
jgi:hypothetical protein